MPSSLKEKLDTVRRQHLMSPTVSVLKDLGGKGSIQQIYVNVAELMKIDQETLSAPSNPSKPHGQTFVLRELGFARAYLKRGGYLDNPSKGVWALTEAAVNAPHIDGPKIIESVQEEINASKRGRTG